MKAAIEANNPGRIHQVEYACEAVKQGSAAVGLKSATHAVVVALKRQPSELASYQKKIVRIDSHVGVAFSGLTSDARVLRFVISSSISSNLIMILSSILSNLIILFITFINIVNN